MLNIKRSNGKDMNLYYINEDNSSYRDPYDNQIKKYDDLDLQNYVRVKNFVQGIKAYSYDFGNSDGLDNLLLSAQHDYVPALCMLAVKETTYFENYYEACQLLDRAVELDSSNGRNWTNININSAEEAKQWLNEKKITTFEEKVSYYSQYLKQARKEDTMDPSDRAELGMYIYSCDKFEKADEQAKIGYMQVKIAQEFGKEIFADKNLDDFNIFEIAQNVLTNDSKAQLEFAYLYSLAKEGNKEAQFLMAEYNCFMKEYSLSSSNDTKSVSGIQKDINKTLFGKYQDPVDRAIDIYEDLAENGHKKSQYIMAYYNYEGKLVKKDLDKAYEWYKKANEQDDNLPFVKVLQEYDNYYNQKSNAPTSRTQELGADEAIKINMFLSQKKKELYNNKNLEQ